MRCWVLSFLLPKYITTLFGERGKKLLDNYLHKLLRHLPEVFEEGPLDEISCEPFEAFIAKLLKTTINNQKVYSLFRLLEFSYQDKPIPTVRDDYGKNKNDIKKIWLQEHTWEPLEIKYENSQVALLISNLKRYKHTVGQEWFENRDEQNTITTITFPSSPKFQDLKNEYLYQNINK